MTAAESRALLALVRRLLGAATDTSAPAPWAALPVAHVRRQLLGPLAGSLGIAAFRNDLIASGLQAERRARFLDEVVTALAARGIRSMLLKGIAYAGSIYPDPAERPMSDIDLMVPAADHAAAAAGLRALGYQHVGGAHQRASSHHAQTWRRGESALDLHRHIVQAGRTRIDLAAVWAAAVPAPQHPAALRPAPLHEYLLHVAHIVRHELTVPLINLIDAVRLEVPGAAELARRWALGRGLAAVQAAMAQLCRDARPPHWWSPSTDELLGGSQPARWLQILRKVRYIDTPSGVVGLAFSTARGQWRRRV